MSRSIELTKGEILPGQLKRVEIDGEAVCVANVEGELFAVSDHCTHARIPLSDGYLEGRQVVCPWHGAMFDLKTGRATCGPAVDALKCYEVRVQGEKVQVAAGDEELAP